MMGLNNGMPALLFHFYFGLKLVGAAPLLKSKQKNLIRKMCSYCLAKEKALHS
jgi:hypothetical protein